MSGIAPPLRSPGGADLDLVAHLADLVAGLRGGGRPSHDRTIVEPEDAAVPGALHAAVADLALVERTTLVAARGGDGGRPRPLPQQQHRDPADVDPVRLAVGQLRDGG